MELVQGSGTTLMNRRQLIGHRIYEVNTGGIFGVIRIPQRHVRTESDDDSSSNEEEPGERQEQQHSRNEVMKH